MRELTGGGTTSLLGGPGSTAGGDTDIFTPRTGAASGGGEIQALDPLGGLDPEPVKKRKGKGVPEAPPIPGAETTGGFDDVFGGMGGGQSTPVVPASGSDAFGF